MMGYRQVDAGPLARLQKKHVYRALGDFLLDGGKCDDPSFMKASHRKVLSAAQADHLSYKQVARPNLV